MITLFQYDTHWIYYPFIDIVEAKKKKNHKQFALLKPNKLHKTKWPMNYVLKRRDLVKEITYKRNMNIVKAEL